MFPLMPDSVFTIWLAPLIKNNGWPFTSLQQPTINTRWQHLLDGITLKSISLRKWARQEMPCSTDPFHHSSIQTILGICAAHIPGWSTNIPGLSADQVFHLITRLRGLKNGRAFDSFHRSRAYIKVYGNMHTPAILLQERGGLLIVDGNHRLAALFSLQMPDKLNIDAWIGR